MLRWLSFFGAVALVAIGVVFYIYGGPPGTLFRPPDDGVPKASPDEKIASAQPQPAALVGDAGPWKGEVAVTPLVVIPGARLTAIHTPQVPSMRDGQLLFFGREVKPGETRPADAFEKILFSLVTEVSPSETTKQDDWVAIDDKWFRPLKKGEDPRPNKVQLYPAKKWFVPVEEGKDVKEGDLLALIDPVTAVDDLAIKLAKFNAAETDRAAEEKQRDEYKERYSRAWGLYQRGAGSYEDATAAKLAYEYHVYETKHKEQDLKVAGSEMRQAETLLQLHQIRSAFNGSVKQLIKHKSEAVKALDTVLEMEDHSKLRIRGRVDLQDMGSLPDPRNPNDKRVVYVEATRQVAPRPRGVLNGHSEAINGVAVSKDNLIVSVSEDQYARVWQKDQGEARRPVKHPAAVRAVACTPPAVKDKNLFLTGAADGVARLYDLTAKDMPALVQEFSNGHKEAINAVAFSPDGRWAVSGGDDRAICLWDVDNGELLKRFPGDWGHKGGVTSVAFLSAGKKLSVVSAGRGDNALIVWPLNEDGSPEKPTAYPHRGGEVTTLGVSPDGSQLLFDQGKDLRVLSAEGNLVGTMTANSGASFNKVALFSPDGKLVLASGGAGRLQLWRAPTAETRGHEFEQLRWTRDNDEQAATTCGAFAPDGSFLVTGTAQKRVIVWPMPTKEEIERRLTAKIINLDPEVTSGQVRVTADLDNPPAYLLPGNDVTLVVYPEK